MVSNPDMFSYGRSHIWWLLKEPFYITCRVQYELMEFGLQDFTAVVQCWAHSVEGCSGIIVSCDSHCNKTRGWLWCWC